MAWKQLYWPKTVCGLNITDVITWNRAAIVKHPGTCAKRRIDYGYNGCIHLI